MATQVRVVPAVYQQPYPKTQEDLRVAWEAGKDFKMLSNGPYCSIRDLAALKEYGYEELVMLIPGAPALTTKVTL